MNAKTPSRFRFLAGLTVLALSACGGGEEAKTATSKAATVEAASASKDGPDALMMAAELASAMANTEVTKTIATIEPGQTVNGALDTGDNQLEDMSYFDAWVFTLPSTQYVEITMRSEAVDPYLSIFTGEPGMLGEHLGSDDDGAGEGFNAQLRGEISAGTYTVMANSFSGGETGAYTLTLDVPGLGSTGGVTGGSGGTGGGSGGPPVLRDGASMSGALEGSDEQLGDGSYFDEWTYMGQAGEQVTVTMTSDAVDPYLLAFRGSSVAGGEYLTEDDDSGGNFNAQITMTLPSAGTYTFVANSFSAGETGSYQIALSSGGSGGTGGGGAGGGVSWSTGGDPDAKYALLVGIDDYPGTGSDLRGPVEDAQIMYRALTQRFGFDPENIVVLNDSQATRENIANGIVQHLGQAGPSGTAVFFYSGHGMQVGRNIGLTGALDPEPRGEGDEALYIYGYDQQSSVLLDEELGFLIETIDAGNALVVVDACHSGEITRGASGGPMAKEVDITDPEVQASLQLPTNFIGAELKAAELTDMSMFFGDLEAIADVFRQPRRHIMWGSSTEDQVSWTSNLGNNASLFTYYVGEALMSAPMSATFADIARGVHDETYAYSRDLPTQQNPVLAGNNANMTLAQFFGM